MNTLLGSLVVLATFVTLCNAQCYFIPNAGSPDHLLNECKDNSGVTYSLNSKWKTDHCEECSCTDSGISCCNTVAIPVGFDKAKCKEIFHKASCSYTVVEKKNPHKACVIKEWLL